MISSTVLIDECTTKHYGSDGSLKVTEKGGEINFYDGAKFVKSDFSLDVADAGDIAAFKTRKSPDRVGLAKSGWVVGRKIRGNQIRKALRKIQVRRADGSVEWVQAVNFGNLNGQGRALNVTGGIDVTFVKTNGEFSQNLVIKDAMTIPQAISANDRLEYWTEIQDNPNLKFWLKNYGYGHPNGGWKVWDKQERIKFEICSVRWKDTELFTLSNDVIMQIETPYDRNRNLVEQKELACEDGKIYLVESVELYHVKNFDYTEPLVLNYTTRTGAASADETWTSGTWYISGNYTLGIYNLTIGVDAVVKFANVVALTVGSTGVFTVSASTTNPAIFTNSNDNSVGETIVGSTGVLTAALSWAIVNTAGVTISITDAVMRFGGTTTGCMRCNATNSSWTLTRLMCEQFSDFVVYASAGVSGRTVTMTDVTIRNCVHVGDYIVFGVDDIYWLRVNAYGNQFLTFFRTSSKLTNSYIKDSRFMNSTGHTIIILGGSIDFYNVSIVGFNQYSAAAYVGIYVGQAGSTGTVNIKYCTITGCNTGIRLLAGSQVVNDDYNYVYGNGTNYVAVTPGANSRQYCPNHEYTVNHQNTGYLEYALESASHWTTPNKVNDAGWEYLLGRTVLQAKTKLAAGANIPPGATYYSDLDSTPPAKATGVSATDQVTSKEVKVDWTDPADADLLDICVAYSSVSAAAAAANANAGTGVYIKKGVQTAIIGGLTNNTLYYFALNSRDTSRNLRSDIGAGDAVSATPTAAPNAAADIDVTTYNTSNVKKALFTEGDTIRVRGNFTTTTNIVNANVELAIKRLSDDGIIKYFFSTTATINGTVQFSTLYGGECDWQINTAEEYYVVASIGGGTPTILTVDNDSDFVVEAPPAPTSDVAVSTTLYTQKSGVNEVNFTLGDTVEVVGSVETDLDVTNADIVVDVKKLSDDSLISNLLTTTANFTANVSRTLANIAGGALSWVITPADEYYIKLTVSGGTPTTFAVQATTFFTTGGGGSGIEIDMITTDTSDNPKIRFSMGDTVRVSGQIKTQADTVDADVVITLTELDGTPVSTLLNTTYTFTADTYATLKAINGGTDIEHTIVQYRDLVLTCSVSNGTPAVYDSSCTNSFTSNCSPTAKTVVNIKKPASRITVFRTKIP